MTAYTNYPSKLDDSINIPAVIDNNSKINAIVINRLRDAILAIEGELGINPSGISGTVKERLDNLDVIITALNDSIQELSNGGITKAFPSDADYILTSSEYIYDWIEFTTGLWSTGHNAIFPAPISKDVGYYKTIFNNTSETITISIGFGITKTIIAATAQRFWFDNSGVFYAGPTFTP